MGAVVDRVVELASTEQLPEVRLLRPQPGDVVVIRLAEDVSDADLHDMAERVRAVFPQAVPVLVLGPGSGLEVVRKDGA